MTQQATSDLKLGTNVAPIVRSQVNRVITAASVLEARLGMNADGPRWTVQGTGRTTRSHVEGAAFGTPDQNAKVAASLSWGFYDTTGEISDESRGLANIANNPAAFNRLFMYEMRDATIDLSKKIEQDCFEGTGTTNSIVGFDDAIDDGNEYAGINRATAAYWRSYVEDQGGVLTTITKDILRGFLYGVADLSGEMPDVGFCSWSVYNKIVGLFDNDVQFIHPGDRFQAGAVVGTASRTMARVEGCLIVPAADGYAADNSGTFYALNSQYVHLEYVPYEDDPDTIVSGVSAGLPFGMQVVKGAKTGHAITFTPRCMVQLVVEKPSACGKLQNIKV